MQYNKNKFNIGDMITLIDTEYAGESFKIAGILEQEFANGDIQYSYKLRDINESGLGLLDMLISEERIEPMKTTKAVKNLFIEYLDQYERAVNPVISKPKLRVGDVVKFQNYDDLMVVKEISESNNGNYNYDVILPNDEDMVCRFEEDFLVLQYHDSNYAHYFTESVSNGLPAWRGELYNVYSLYFDPDIHAYGELNRRECEEYNNDTIPPVYMEHILRSHSIYERINDVIKSSENRKAIMEELGISINDLNKIESDIKRKINARNLNDMDSDSKRKITNKMPSDLKFTDQELAFVDEVCKIDGRKDHYPIEMTNIQIMQAVKEAYSGAMKIGHRKIQDIKDKRNEETISSTKGRILYEGVSRKGMVIQFWYNFDLDLIETAYPVPDSNSKKHQRNYNESVNASKVKFKEGDKIRITKGDDIDYIGEVKEVDKNNQYVVFLNEIHRYRLYSGNYLESVDDEAFMESKAFSDNLFLESGNAVDDSECKKHLGYRIRGEYRQRDPRKPRLIIAIDKDDESHVPHFHVFKSENDFRLWENSISLAITDNKYYHHESHNSTLNESELDAVLRCFGQETSANPFSENVWQYLIYYWNIFNEGYDIDINTPIPDYSRLFSNNPDNVMSDAAIMEFATAEPVVNEYPVKKFDRNLPPDYHLILEAEERKAKEMKEVNENTSSDDILDMKIEDSYFEMATIVRDVDRKGKILIAVNPERDRLNIAYFKVYDSNDIKTAKRVIRLHFKDSGMEYHNDMYEKWILNSNDKKHIKKLLESPNKRHKSYSNWQYMCFQWNYENNLIDDDIDAYFNGDYDEKYINHPNTALTTAYVPSTQKMPETWNDNPDEEAKTESTALEDDVLDMEIEDSYFEMAQVKWGFMSIKLAIYGKEGDGYPHFHFFKGCAPEKGIPENKKNGGGCICIESANYFIHGAHKDTMEPKEIDGLIKFLKAPHKTLKKITNWEYIVDEWNQNNPDSRQLPIDLPIPNYKSNMKSVQKDNNGTKNILEIISKATNLDDDILNSTIDGENTHYEFYQLDNFSLKETEEMLELSRKLGGWDEYVPDSVNINNVDDFFVEMAEIYPNYNTHYNVGGKVSFRMCVVQGDEGPVPHVHIYYNNKGDKNHGKVKTVAYVCLGKNEYAPQHEDETKVLSSKERKALVAFFNTKVPEIYGKDKNDNVYQLTCWQYAVRIWDDSYGEKYGMKQYFEVDEETGLYKMPDFSNIGFSKKKNVTTESTALEGDILDSTIDDEVTEMSESMGITDFLNLDIDKLL